jgi:predicted phosphodiesterase
VRYLIVSDIHANWEALEAVLEHSRGAYDAVLCCGDLVGYGADPNPVVDWVRGNVSAIVRGNHDKSCCGLEDLEWFNPVARTAASWTAAALTFENMEYLRGLPKGPVAVEDFQLVHGTPLDEDDYLVSMFAVSELRRYLEKQVSVFGHTHLQGGFFCHRNGVRRLGPTPPDQDRMALELEAGASYLINPGSVGQPRDSDPRAAYLLYDPAAHLVEYRRVPYDIQRAQEKILAAGLPELLAARLETGS